MQTRFEFQYTLEDLREVAETAKAIPFESLPAVPEQKLGRQLLGWVLFVALAALGIVLLRSAPVRSAPQPPSHFQVDVIVLGALLGFTICLFATTALALRARRRRLAEKAIAMRPQVMEL